ncbi:MAG: helix-turn-helix domain-containing protein [Armatimonadetes bacterium]|nr:helix-turn-helix domain-containing protein [Armatimonadota bacterium]
MELLLTVEQAAQRLQAAPFTVRRHLREGRLRGIKRGRDWRIPESALLESPPQKNDAWAQAAARLSAVYADSFANDGELTEFSSAPSDDFDLGSKGETVGA